MIAILEVFSGNKITIVFLIIALAAAFFVFYRIGHHVGKLQQDIKWKKRIPLLRDDAVKRSRAVLAGQFSEQLAPYLPDFRYSPKDCRFMGQPVDLIVFNGMNEKNINEVIFIEIKSGSSQLSQQEKNLRDAVNSGRVRYEEYRIPDKLISGENEE
ncbi:MAG: hypothetical protein JW982_09275 [Spirochaetes bacterium]|nr:hypothetical protein [Spirochaetota bacterium]